MASLCFSIRVRYRCNSQLTLSVQESTTVQEVKAEVCSAIGVETSRQRLIFQGKEARNGDTVGALKMQEGFVFQMIERGQDGLDSDTQTHRRQMSLVDILSVLRPSPQRRTRRREVSWTHRLECIHQNLLTLQVLLEMRREAPLAADPLQAFDPARRRMKVGLWVDAQDTVNQWLEAQISAVSESQVRIHYLGWPQRWDEWLPHDSPRIQFFRSKTRQAVHAPMHSPYPVMTVDAFGTVRSGLLDYSELLFEASQVLSTILPLLEKFCALRTAAEGELITILTSPENLSDSLSDGSSPRYFTSETLGTNEEDRTDETPVALQQLTLGAQVSVILDRLGRLLADLGLLHCTRPDAGDSGLRAMPPQRDLTTPFPDIRHLLALLRPLH